MKSKISLTTLNLLSTKVIIIINKKILTVLKYNKSNKMVETNKQTQLKF